MKVNPTVVLHTDKPQATLNLVKKKHPDLTFLTCETYAELPSVIEKSSAAVVYSVRFAGTPDFPRQALLDSDTVKWIAVGGSGTDHLQPWRSDQLTVTNAAGVAADMMAEYVLGSLLNFRLGLRHFHKMQQAKTWFAGSVTPIEGSTALILGLGHTGCAVARRFNSMGMHVVGTRARTTATEFVDEVHPPESLFDLLPRADVIVCTVPLIKSTRNLLSTEAFDCLKPGCVLIDVSRGGVVNEQALLSALESGKLHAAALDVFEQEPLSANHPFWNMDNVLLTPHCSSVYEGWESKSVELFSANLSRYCEGRPLQNIVDPDRGY